MVISLCYMKSGKLPFNTDHCQYADGCRVGHDLHKVVKLAHHLKQK